MAPLRLRTGPGATMVGHEVIRGPGDEPQSGPALRRSERPAAADAPRGRARSALAGALIALGLGGEIAAARWLIDGRTLDALLLHAPAALAWVLGSIALDGRLTGGAAASLVRAWWPGRPAGRSDDSAHSPAGLAISGRALSAALFVLLLPPGLGAIAFSLAFVVSGWLPVYRPSGRMASDVVPTGPAPLREPVDRLRELDIQPLVDVVRGADAELKRAAIEVLGNKGTVASVRLLRGLLTDPHPDVRSAAGVMLFKLENDFTGDVRRAARRAAERPDRAELHVEHAVACYRYGRSGLLGESSARFYLGRAGDALELARELDPSEPEALRWLARVHAALDDPEAALAAVETALARSDDDPDLFLLGAEIALRHDRAARVVDLARRGLDRSPEAGPARLALEWWTQHAAPSSEVRR